MPFGNTAITPPEAEITGLTIDSAFVANAIASYQAFHQVALSPLIAAFYPQRSSARVRANGIADTATKALMQMPRCECKDYAYAESEPLLGSGSWKSCNSIGDFHCATVRFTTQVPSFLTPIIDEIWSRVVQAYAELGLLFKRDDNAQSANIDISFVQPDSNWIGLAIVGGVESCGSSIWARFDRNYKPTNLVSEWTTLIKHELGHNCGLQHSQGGVMNPYIVAGLPISWSGDPSHALLTRRFGGVPIPSTPNESKLVIARKYSDGRYQDVLDLPAADGGNWFNR